MSKIPFGYVSALFITIALLGVLDLARPAQAVSIDIDQSGNILFYQSSVLGDDDEKEESEKEEDKEVEDEKEKDEKRKERPIDVVSSSRSEKEVRVSVEDENTAKVKVSEIRKSKTGRAEDDEKRQIREIEDTRVELEIEDENEDIRELKREIERQRLEAQKEASGLSDENKKIFLERKEEEFQLKITEKQNELERKGEVKEEFKNGLIEIKTEVKDGQTELKLKTQDGFEARLRNAEFVVNPDTGAVTVVDANGGEHELLHFPDEALQAVQKSRITLPNGAEVEIEVQADGLVKQRIKNVTKKQKLFGIFNRDVQGEAVVDDATGEVEFEQEPTLVNQVLSIFGN